MLPHAVPRAPAAAAAALGNLSILLDWGAKSGAPPLTQGTASCGDVTGT